VNAFAWSTICPKLRSRVRKAAECASVAAACMVSVDERSAARI